MIKSEEGIVRYKGSDNEIRADLICIFRALSQGDIVDGEEDARFLYWLAHVDEDGLGRIKKKLEDLMI